MLNGLVLTPPILGRISIGHTVERNGKRLPQKDNQFTLTTQIQQRGQWIKHPLDALLREQQADDKLREIPVQLMFNDPELNLRAEYALFDRSNARPLCMGNGIQSIRQGKQGQEQHPCPNPQFCALAQSACKPYGRLNVLIRHPQSINNHSSINNQGEDDAVYKTNHQNPQQDNHPLPVQNHRSPATDVVLDPMGSFIFRTTGFNSIRTLSSRLRYFQALSGDLLACLPLALRLRGKSTRQSFGQAIYYVDLTLPTGMSIEQALCQAQDLHRQRQAMGYQQLALDEAARKGFAQSGFEEDEDTASEVIEEFYPPASTIVYRSTDDDSHEKRLNNYSESIPQSADINQTSTNLQSQAKADKPSKLTTKLQKKAQSLSA